MATWGARIWNHQLLRPIGIHVYVRKKGPGRVRRFSATSSSAGRLVCPYLLGALESASDFNPRHVGDAPPVSAPAPPSRPFHLTETLLLQQEDAFLRKLAELNHDDAQWLKGPSNRRNRRRCYRAWLKVWKAMLFAQDVFDEEEAKHLADNMLTTIIERMSSTGRSHDGEM